MVLKRFWAVFLLLLTLAAGAAENTSSARRAALIAQIKSLEQAGIRLHRTTDTPFTTRYVLQIVDEQNATDHLLAGWGEGLIDPRSRADVANWLREGRIGIKIDWDRYLKHQPKSIRVTFRGNALTRKHTAFQQWLDGDHLGAWLSFGEGDRLTQAAVIPIDADFQEGNATIHWRLEGYDLAITRSHPVNRYDLATVLHGTLFAVERTEANRTSQSIRIDAITCHTDTTKRFDGKADCHIPHVALRDGVNRLEVSRTTLDQTTHDNNGTVTSVVNGNVDQMNLSYHDNDEEGEMKLSGLSGAFEVILGKTISYHTQTRLRSLISRTKDKRGETLQIELSGVEEKIAIEGLYNFVTELTRIARGGQWPKRDDNLTDNLQKLSDEIFARVVHHGLDVAIDPLRLESLSIVGAGIQENIAPVRLTLHARLDPNTIDVRHSAAPMLLLGFVHLNGQWTLSKKDFQTLLGTLPVKIKMLLMLFVRYEKDQAIFDLKFDKGHLQVNGRQVM